MKEKAFCVYQFLCRWVKATPVFLCSLTCFKNNSSLYYENVPTRSRAENIITLKAMCKPLYILPLKRHLLYNSKFQLVQLLSDHTFSILINCINDPTSPNKNTTPSIFFKAAACKVEMSPAPMKPTRTLSSFIFFRAGSSMVSVDCRSFVLPAQQPREEKV